MARLRREKGWTQKMLADAVGLSQEYIEDIEQGRRQAKTKTLAIIAAKLGVGIKELCEGEEY
jgi:transcriptional regulator with XRE-family HTH domain